MLFLVSMISFFSMLYCQDITIATIGRFCCTDGGVNQVYCSSFPGTNQSTCLDQGFGASPEAQAHWGRPTVGGKISGVGFSGVSRTFTAINSSFFLGTLSHENFPVLQWANKTELWIRFAITINGVFIKNLDLNWVLVVDETPDVGPVSSCKYNSTTACADAIIPIKGNWTSEQKFSHNNVDYTINLQGFRESNSSNSALSSIFISQENNNNAGYLFALVTVINECARGCETCDVCSIQNTCVDPEPTFCNCGTRNKTNCTQCDCQSCPNCASPRSLNNRCNCTCPSNLNCGLGVVSENSPTCCDCSAVSCPVGFNVTTFPNGTCGCTCPRDSSFCTSPNQRFNSTKCGCDCLISQSNCTSGQTFNPNTCACECPSSVSCQPPFFINQSTCACSCNVSALQCTECEVPDLQTCTCRVNLNASCTDRDLCNTNGRCNASGVCVGVPKCPILDCQRSTCVPNVGECTAELFPNGTACGSSPCDNTCWSGQCLPIPVLCSNNTCSSSVCNATNGLCQVTNFPNGLNCDDGKKCTFNDTCDNGQCVGLPVICQARNETNATECNGPRCLEDSPFDSLDLSTGKALCHILPLDNDTRCGRRCFLDFCLLGACQFSLNKTCTNLTETACAIANCTEERGCYLDEDTPQQTNPGLCLIVPPPTFIAPAIVASALIAAIAAGFFCFKKGIGAAASGAGGGGAGQLGAVTANPLYESSGKQVENPLFEGATQA